MPMVRSMYEQPIPRTRHELFPEAISDAPLRLVAPPKVGWSPRVWSTIVSCSFIPGALLLVEAYLHLPLFRILRAATNERTAAYVEGAWLVTSITLAVAFGLGWWVLVLANGWRQQDGPRVDWTTWAGERGFEPAAVAELERLDAPMFANTRRRNGRWWSLRPKHLYMGRLDGMDGPALVGAARWVRRVPGSRTDDVRRVRACFVAVNLGPDVAAEYPGSRMVRVVRSLHAPAAEGEEPRERELVFEATELHETACVWVAGGDDLEWRALFDTTLVAALSYDLDIEFQQHGSTLVVATQARDWWRRSARAGRMDTLCAAARLLAHRFEQQTQLAIAGHRADEAHQAGARRQQRVGTYLDRERARDLELDPDALFEELGRYTSAEEVADVRAKVDAGEFPLEWLDDLVYHRRAAFWAAHPDAA
jgi:hypothetical protein